MCLINKQHQDTNKVRVKTGLSALQICLTISTEAEHSPTSRLTAPFLGAQLTEVYMYICSPKDIYHHIPGSFICNVPTLRTAQMSTRSEIKSVEVHTHNGILYNKKKEETTATPVCIS